MGNELKNEYRFVMNDGAEEEYYEEEYPEDGEFDEDGEYYDDAYDDGYYEDAELYDGEYDQISPEDEKLDQVLNELAEMRRSIGVAPAQMPAVQGMPMPAYQAVSYIPSYTVDPGYPIFITPPCPPHSSGNEVAMYNEITRLREELTRMNSSHEMHVELSRLKENMERENRQKEQQLQEEIRRLNEKISALSGK